MVGNNDLQKIFDRISHLEKNLSAEIIIKEEEGYWGAPSRSFHTEERGCYDNDEEEWHVTVPKIAEPILPIREAAAVELKQIFDTSEWYIARYRAWEVLHLPLIQLIEEKQKWLALLINDLKLPKKGHPENVQKINKARDELDAFGYSGFDLLTIKYKNAILIIAVIIVCALGYLFLPYSHGILYLYRQGIHFPEPTIIIGLTLLAIFVIGKHLIHYLRKAHNQIR